MKTNLLINNLVKIEKNQDYSDVKISIETIDKKKPQSIQIKILNLIDQLQDDLQKIMPIK